MFSCGALPIQTACSGRAHTPEIGKKRCDVSSRVLLFLGPTSGPLKSGKIPRAVHDIYARGPLGAAGGFSYVWVGSGL